MKFKSAIKVTVTIVLVSSIMFFVESCVSSKKHKASFDPSMPIVPAEHFALVKNNFSQDGEFCPRNEKPRLFM
jgi:hypothetical protein